MDFNHGATYQFTLVLIEIPVAQPDRFTIADKGVVIPGMRPGQTTASLIEAELQDDVCGNLHEPVLENVDDDSMVPATSLLREFIGGSAYDLH